MPVSSLTKKDKAFADLKRSIITMDIAPGALLDEVELCERFALSRTPMREILQRLSGEGFVVLERNKSASVAPLSHSTLREFFQTAPMIYSAILRLAAENALPEEIVALKNAQVAFRKALKAGNAQERTFANNEFHVITCDMAKNRYLRLSFNRLLIDHSRIGMTFYKSEGNKLSQNIVKASEQHDAIIDAISAGDGDTAAQLAGDHWDLTRDQIERYVMPSSLTFELDERVRKSA